MEFFNHWSARLTPQLRRLQPARWLASVVLGLTLAGAVLLVTRKPSQSAHEPLWAGQASSPRDLAKMTAAFRKAGLPETRVEGEQILVPVGRREAYLAALEAAQALPADFDEALERYVAKSNPFASHQQHEVGYKYAIQMKLAKIVAGMRGVETASVQYDEVKKSGFPPTVEKRALVAVRPAGNRPLEFDQVEAIRDTVAGSIGGLEQSHVTVTDLAAGRAYPGSPEHRAAQLASQYQTAAQRALEQEFRQKIEQRLAKYPDVVVGVNVQLPPPVERSPADAASSALTPLRVSVSIDVPKSYFKKVWAERQTTSLRQVPNARELEEIAAEINQTLERAVAALLPPATGDLAAVPPVTVTSYDDFTSLPESAAERLPAWLADMRRPGPLAVGGMVLLVSWIVWRGRIGRTVPTRDLAAAEAAEAMNDLPDIVVGDAARATISFSSPVHREITQVVQRDPETAAEILRQWIGEAA